MSALPPNLLQNSIANDVGVGREFWPFPRPALPLMELAVSHRHLRLGSAHERERLRRAADELGEAA
jgi:hypothetical protein